MGAHFMYKNIKPPTTYSQQVNRLKQRDIEVSDSTECESFLSRVNYYRLSGYFLPFINSATDKCYRPMKFETLMGIYNFDAELRNLIAFAIERVEIYIRTQLAYFHAHQYGALGYTDIANYNTRHDHIAFMSRIQTCINENAKAPVVVHHKVTYGGKFPIWVIIDYFSLGMLSHFYTDMKNHDKAIIAKNLYSANYQMLSSWLRCLTDLRNRCAHYSRLYYWVFSAVPKMGGIPYSPDRTLYTQLYMLKLLYPDSSEWNERFCGPLEILIAEYDSQIFLTHMGFPNNWKSLLLKK